MKSLSVTIQMKATEQYFPVVLFNVLYKVVLHESLTQFLCESAERKVIKQCFPVVLYIRLNK